MTNWKKFGDTKCWRISGDLMTIVNRRFFGDGADGAGVSYPERISTASSPSPFDDSRLFTWYDWGWWDQSETAAAMSSSTYMYYVRGDSPTVLHDAFRPATIGANLGSGPGAFRILTGSRYGSDAPGKYITVDRMQVNGFKYPASCSVPQEWNGAKITGSEIWFKFKYEPGATLATGLFLQFENVQLGSATSRIEAWITHGSGKMYLTAKYSGSYGGMQTANFTGSASCSADFNWHSAYFSLPETVTPAIPADCGTECVLYGGLDGNHVPIRIWAVSGSCRNGTNFVPGQFSSSISMNVCGDPGASNNTAVSLYDIRVAMAGITASYLTSSNGVDTLGTPVYDRKRMLPWQSYAAPYQEALMFRKSGSIGMEFNPGGSTKYGVGRCEKDEELRSLLVNGNFTVNMWLSKSLNSNAGLMGWDGGASTLAGGKLFEMRSTATGFNNGLTVRFGTGSGGSVTERSFLSSSGANYLILTGSWTMITVVVEKNLTNAYQNTSSLYSNGIFQSKVYLTGTIDTTGVTPYTSGSLHIGCNYDDATSLTPATMFPWYGRMGDFRIYSGALTQADITSLYNSSSWIYANDP